MARTDSNIVDDNDSIPPYIPTRNDPTNSPNAAPCFLPSFNIPPSNPEKASKLIWYKLTTFAKDRINPATTPTVDPIAAPPTKAKINTIYLDNICSSETE